MGDEWVPFLQDIPVREPLMWVIDTETETVIDMTPATAKIIEADDFSTHLRTLSRESHLETARTVARAGEPQTLTEWRKYCDSWHKLGYTFSHVGGSRVLEQALDITSLDPRAEWLARINLESQRLEMDSGESISFDEFVVLHMLLKGYKHKRIAHALNVSTKTVEYRISRLKIALGVDSTGDMMLLVSSSGLIHLGLVEIDLDNPALTELELYKKVAN